MRIAIGLRSLSGFGGTESYALTVAGELERLGHDVWVQAPELGPSAEHAAAHGVRIVPRTADLPECDVALSQDADSAFGLAERFPEAVRVMVAHSAVFSLQSPPQLPDVCHAVVTLNDRVGRRVAAMAAPPRQVRLRQPIDLQRFCYRRLEPAPGRKPKALVLSNYLRGARLEMVADAARAAGFDLEHVGTFGMSTATPEHRIAEASVVIGLGRGVIEAMASGRAAYVLDVTGGDGWVTEATYPIMESDGFSGRALGGVVSAERLTADLAGWDEWLGEVGRDLACTHHDVGIHAVELVELFASLDPTPLPPTPTSELARLVRLEWDRHGQARGEAAEAARLRTALAAAHEEIDALLPLRTECDALRWALEVESKERRDLQRFVEEVNRTRTMRGTRSLRTLYGRIRGVATRTSR